MVTPCSLVDLYKRFEGNSCMHRAEKNWLWRRDFSSFENKYLATKLYGETFQKPISLKQ